MKRKLTLLVALNLFIISVSFSQSKEEKEVTDAVEKLRTAMLNGDKSTLENITTEKLSYGHSSGLIEGKKEFVGRLASGASDFVTLELSDQTISISDKVAIVRHTLNAKTNDGGKPGEAHLKVMLIWQKQKGGWKLLARQAIKITT